MASVLNDLCIPVDDNFSFESILSMGTQTFSSQPFEPPSPSALEAFPSLAPTPAKVVVRGGIRWSFKKTIEKPTWIAYKGTVVGVLPMRVDAINAMVNSPQKKSPAPIAAATPRVATPLVKSGIVFNPVLVRCA